MAIYGHHFANILSTFSHPPVSLLSPPVVQLITFLSGHVPLGYSSGKNLISLLKSKSNILPCLAPFRQKQMFLFQGSRSFISRSSHCGSQLYSGKHSVICFSSRSLKILGEDTVYLLSVLCLRDISACLNPRRNIMEAWEVNVHLQRRPLMYAQG